MTSSGLFNRPRRRVGDYTVALLCNPVDEGILLKMASAVVPLFITRLAQRIADIIFQAVVAVLIVLGYLFLALFIYVVLREIIVPEKVHLRPVHFFFQ